MRDRFFGEIPDVPQGTVFANRRELHDAGVHCPLQAGISGAAAEGADSIVISGGYEDDQDSGDRIIYTGHGGRDPATGQQVGDQVPERGNAGLVLSCEQGLPVRVIRAAGGDPTWSPATGYRYDGLYVVSRHWSERGRSGHTVWRFELEKIVGSDLPPQVETGGGLAASENPGVGGVSTDKAPPLEVDKPSPHRESLSGGSYRGSDASSARRYAEYIARERKDEKFSNLFPNLTGSTQRIGWPEASNRLTNVLRREGNPSWGHIAELTPEGLIQASGWRAFGRTTLIELLCRGIELSALLDPSEQDDPARASFLAETAESLALIGSWGRLEHGLRTLGEAFEMADELAADEVPEEVISALADFRGVDTGRLTSRLDTTYTLQDGLEYVLGAAEPRGLAVLKARDLQSDKSQRPTLDELGAQANLTRERIRQLGKAAARAIEGALDSPTGGIVRRTALRLRRQLGIALPQDRAQVILAETIGRGSGNLAEQTSLGRGLLLWVAGPYVQSDGWLVRGSSRALKEESRRVLEGLLAEGSATWAQAIDAIQSIGLSEPEVAEDWLNSMSRFESLDGYLVDSRGGLADKAFIVLSGRGESMSRAEILGVVGHGSRGSLGNLMAQDPRFVRLDRDAFGLAEWGGDEYVGIVGLIGREIDQAGGVVGLAELTEILTDRYSVAATSVITYASAHPKFVVVDGNVRRRRADEPMESSGDVRREAACYRTTAGWAWRRRVDRDVLRGSGLGIPPGFAVEAGARPGANRTRLSEFGEIKFLWTSMQPAIGSIRAPARELGAVEGDWLFVELEGGERVTFWLVRAADMDSTDSRHARFALLIGSDLETYQRDHLEAISQALGLEQRLSSFRAAGTLLRSRGETELADLLPDDDNEDAITDVLRHLGFDT